MKKLLLLVNVIAILTVFSCCKEKTEPYDFRDKYIGSWDFMEDILIHNFDSLGQHVEDTIAFSGNIRLGATANELIIPYSKDSSIVLIVNELGVLSGFHNHECNGKFEGENKIHLYLRWGGLGGFMRLDLNGAKE